MKKSRLALVTLLMLALLAGLTPMGGACLLYTSPSGYTLLKEEMEHELIQQHEHPCLLYTSRCV